MALRHFVVLVVTALLFAGLCLARVQSDTVGDAVLLMFVVPIAILAFELGLRGGIGGALVAIVLVAAWDASAPSGIGPAGYVARATAFLVLGAGIGQIVDIRDRLQGELRHTRDMSLHMIATATFDGFFRSLNPAWERVLGMPRSELLSQPFIEFVHPDDVAETSRALTNVSDGDIVNFRNRYRTADGSYRWLEWNAHCEPGASLIYATAHDVTIQQQAEVVLSRHADLLERQVLDRTYALEQARLETLHRLALAAEFRDDDSKEHTVRVGRTAGLIALELGLPTDFVAQIQEAAPLHDIGKISVSDAVLLKPGRLTSGELMQMRTHAQTGAAILSGSDSPVLQLAAEIALTHHERWDGTGYPHGLKHDAIPLAGRIVAVADVFDALTHARPYKAAWPLHQALATIHEGSGEHFDAQVVAAFERLDPVMLLELAPPEPSLWLVG